MHIPDVSEFQPNVNWNQVFKVNGGAAIVRAMYGASHVDGLWAAGRRASAHAANVQVLGIYQYVRADQDVTTQAQAFVNQVGSLKQGEFAVMDLEEGNGDQSGRAHTWLNYVNSRLPNYKGYQGAWLYSFEAFIAEHGLSSFFNGPDIHCWIAAYQLNEPAIGHSLWQHSNGTAAKCIFEPWSGIGPCDCSAFSGGMSDLKAKVWNQSAPPPANSGNYSQEEVMNITRDDFTRTGGAYPISLPTDATAVRFFSNSPAHIRVDTRSDSGVVDVELGYDSAHNILCPVNAIVVHRDDPADTGTNDVSYAINY